MSGNVLSDAQSPSSPVAAVGKKVSLLAATTCAASGNMTYTDIIDVGSARRLTLLLDYNPAAAAGRPGFYPAVSAESAKPAAGDDVWFIPCVWDGTVTAAVLDGAVPSGADYSKQPDFAGILYRPMHILLEPADNAADEYRQAVTIDVTAYKWVQIAYGEDGDTANPGDLAIDYVLSV